MAWMEHERAALVETLRAADPEAPTLCEGWSVRDLLAHLVEREQMPVRRGIDVLERRAPGTERFQGHLADGARTPEGYRALVDRFAAGIPSWSPLAWAGDAAHLLEYVVHHEDVRRAGPNPAEPRVLPTDLVRAVWERLGPLAWMAYRSSPVGVVQVVPGGPRRVVHRGADAVVVLGDPVELALHAVGRDEAADVEVLGRDDVVDRYLAAR